MRCASQPRTTRLCHATSGTKRGSRTRCFHYQGKNEGEREEKGWRRSGNSAVEEQQQESRDGNEYEDREDWEKMYNENVVWQRARNENLKKLRVEGTRNHVASTVGRAVYTIARLDAFGNVEIINVKKRDLLRVQALAPRDLRRLDPSLSATKTSDTLVVKDDVMVINLGGVRAIVAADYALLFEPDSDLAKLFLKTLTTRLKSVARSRVAFRTAESVRVFAGGPLNSGSEEVDNTHLIPFELEVLEAALMVATGTLDQSLLRVTERVSGLLRVLPSNITAEALEELRRVKQTLVELISKADTLRELLEEVMDDEDDLQDLLLTRKKERSERARVWKELREQLRGDKGEDEEVGDLLAEVEAEAEMDEDALEEMEDVLEYYLQRCATAHNEAERLLAGARDLEESISVSLSSRRFAVNRLELTLSMASFAVAIGALVSGIFGMNLRSTLEMSVRGFYLTTAFIVFGCLFLFWTVYRFTKRRGIL